MLPNLMDCEWSITAGSNAAYNCIAHSVGVTNKFISDVKVSNKSILQPDGTYKIERYSVDEETRGGVTYWYIDGKFGNKDMVYQDTGVDNDIDKFYSAYSLTPTASSALDAKVVYFSKYHAAKKRTCVCGGSKWVMFDSKGGGGITIEHRLEQAKKGGFGDPIKYYK